MFVLYDGGVHVAVEQSSRFCQCYVLFEQRNVVLKGLSCLFSSSAIPLKITILETMVLRDVLVYDSENWSADQPFPVVFIFSLEPSFIEAVMTLIKVFSSS